MSYHLYAALGVNVWASDRALIATLYHRLPPQNRKSRAMRQARHDLYRAMLRHHHRQQDFCRRFNF